MDADPLGEAAFKKFVAQRKMDLERIQRGTRNEHEFADVKNEAWLIAYELKIRKSVAINFLDRSFQDLLISHLYQHLVRYTERNIRHAVRLDHAGLGNDQDGEPPPLLHRLVGEDGQHPLTKLVEQEETLAQDLETGIQYSLAGAYVRLLRHFGNRMRAVADYLLISKSYAYRRCAHARLLATCQKPIPLPMMEETFIPRPWRRFRLQRVPVQFSLKFDDELPFGSSQQRAAKS